jgi:hypothetical protein
VLKTAGRYRSAGYGATAMMSFIQAMPELTSRLAVMADIPAHTAVMDAALDELAQGVVIRR